MTSKLTLGGYLYYDESYGKLSKHLPYPVVFLTYWHSHVHVPALLHAYPGKATMASEITHHPQTPTHVGRA